MFADPSGKLRGQAVASLKTHQLPRGIGDRVPKDFVWVAVQRAPDDFASFRLKLVKSADLFERAVSTPFQLVMALAFQVLEIFAQGISGARTSLLQIRKCRSFIDPFGKQEDVAVSRQYKLMRAHQVDREHRSHGEN